MERPKTPRKAGSLPDFEDRSMSARTPQYRLHKPTNQAVVTLSGKDFYLGRFGSATSRAEYDRIVAEWLTNGRRLPAAPDGGGPADLSVNELLLAYIGWADEYYRKNGEPTGEADNIRYAVRPLRRLYGHTLAKDFGPLALKSVRQAMIKAGLCRNEVNRRTRHVTRVFGWGVENELIPPSVHHGLKAVSSLKKGRSEIRESEPVKPVPDASVEAVKPFVARQVWAMIQLQRLTGMRPGEVCRIRTIDVDASGKVWNYVPESHKTEHHGRSRVICIGPKAQEILRPWLRSDPTARLFSPREAMEERQAERRRNRKSPMTPSQRARSRKGEPRRSASDGYESLSYCRAIKYGCKLAAVPDWHPNQLRHNAATSLRKKYGLDTARVILGHTSPAVTEVYAEIDREKALSVIESDG
jgi:integrase